MSMGKIHFVPLREKNTKRIHNRFWCDKGLHWVTGIGLPVHPAIEVVKNGLTFRDCGKCGGGGPDGEGNFVDEVLERGFK